MHQMLYEKTGGPIAPFHEDKEGYLFRFFCSAQPPPSTPTEQAIPKSKPEYICRYCKSRITVKRGAAGAYLVFSGGDPGVDHFAAKETQ